MPKPLTKPPLYALTLTMNALMALPKIARFRKPPMGFKRGDGKVDVGISMAFLDQLQTAALPKENLSDTVLRLCASRKA